MFLLIKGYLHKNSTKNVVHIVLYVNLYCEGLIEDSWILITASALDLLWNGVDWYKDKKEIWPYRYLKGEAI